MKKVGGKIRRKKLDNTPNSINAGIIEKEMYFYYFKKKLLIHQWIHEKVLSMKKPEEISHLLMIYR